MRNFFRLLGGGEGGQHIHMLGLKNGFGGLGGFKGFSMRKPSFKTGGTFNINLGLYSIKNAKRSNGFWSIRSN